MRTYTETDAVAWVQQVTSYDYAWVIETDSQLIGHIRLQSLDSSDHRGSIAIGIDDVTRLGQGLGSEAINLVQQFAFQSLNLHRLTLRVLAYNHRAIRAYQKCGFIIEGREREAAFVDGEWHDDIIMGIIDRDFTPV